MNGSSSLCPAYKSLDERGVCGRWQSKATLLVSFGMLCTFVACSSGDGDAARDDDGSSGGTGGASSGSDADMVVPATPPLKRLTQRQHINALRALLGDDLVLPRLAVEQSAGGLAAVAAGTTTASEQDVESYERMTADAVAQAFDDPQRRARLVTCAGSSGADVACTKSFVAAFGRRAFRRALTESERDRFEALAQTARAIAGGDAWAGLKSVASAMLQSPKFLYRFEFGEADEQGRRVLTAQERASRLSFALVDSIPDEELLSAAEDGRLLDKDELRRQAQRLLDDPRSREAFRAFVEENYRLNDLERSAAPVSKELLADMKSEVLDAAERAAFGSDGDNFLSFFVSTAAPAIPALRTHYGLPAGAGFPEQQERVGLFGTAAFLTLTSTAVHTSPTARGKFIRERILCQEVPVAMAGVDTSLPPASDAAPTTRERLDAHRSKPECASCHQFMDPPGYAFERFDQTGKYRTSENGAALRTDGVLDEEDPDTQFSGPRELVKLIMQQPEFALCLARSVFKQLTAYQETHMDVIEDDLLIEGLAQQLVEHRFDIRAFLLDVVGSDSFVTRQAKEPQ